MDPFSELFSFNVIEKTYDANKNQQRNQRFYQQALADIKAFEKADVTAPSSLPIDKDRRSGEDRRLDNEADRKRFELRNKNDRRKNAGFFVKA